MNLLDARPAELTAQFVSSYCGMFPEVEPSRARELIDQTVRYYREGDYGRGELRHLQRMENAWYSALANGEPDWTVYNDAEYFTDLWACWLVYSRPYLRNLRTAREVEVTAESGPTLFSILEPWVRSVVDLGCGVGYTSAALTQLFPRATVYATNLTQTKQWKFCEKMAASYGFKLSEHFEQIQKPVDLVFASEYFEHFQEPLQHLREVLGLLRPRFLYVANAFGARSIGHFDEYVDNGQRMPGKAVNRPFAAELLGRGYQKLKTTLWNGRPALWMRA